MSRDQVNFLLLRSLYRANVYAHHMHVDFVRTVILASFIYLIGSFVPSFCLKVVDTVTARKCASKAPCSHSLYTDLGTYVSYKVFNASKKNVWSH